MSRKKLKPLIIAAVVVGGLLVGVAISLGLAKINGSPQADMKKTDNSGGYGKFPTYVLNSPTPNARQGYQAAVDFTDYLNQVPCFCGCGKHAGHKSVRYCFIEDKQGDNIMFDPHGSGCKMCVDIALDVEKGVKKGDSIKDIRERVTDQYRDSLNDATPTPPIEE